MIGDNTTSVYNELDNYLDSIDSPYYSMDYLNMLTLYQVGHNSCTVSVVVDVAKPEHSRVPTYTITHDELLLVLIKYNIKFIKIEYNEH